MMEALPLPAGSGRQPGESNLYDGGELTEAVSHRVLRNGANDGSLVLKVAQPGAPGSPVLERMQRDAERTQLGVYC